MEMTETVVAPYELDFFSEPEQTYVFAADGSIESISDDDRVYVWIPRALKLAAIVPAGSCAKVARRRDAVAWIIGLLVSHRRNEGLGVWRPLSHEGLKQALVREDLDWALKGKREAPGKLEALGIIDVDYQYFAQGEKRPDGTSCRRYRLNSQWTVKNWKLRQHEITSKKIIKRVREEREIRAGLRNEFVFESDMVSWIDENLNRLSFSTGVTRRINNLVKRYANGETRNAVLTTVHKGTVIFVTEEEYRSIIRGPVRTLNSEKNNVRRKSTIDDFGWRNHNPVTQLSSDLRKYLRVDAKKQLIGVDISASQIAIMAGILRKLREIIGNQSKDRQVEAENNKGIFPLLLRNLAERLGPDLRAHLAGIEAWSEASQKFFQACEKGDIYEVFAGGPEYRDVGKKGLISEGMFGRVTSLDRMSKSLKLRKTFSAGAAANERRLTSPYGAGWLRLSEDYSEIAQCMRLLKSPNGIVGDSDEWLGDSRMKDKPHRWSAMICQRAESLIMREYALRDFRERTRGDWALPLHDCMIVELGNSELAAQCIKDAFRDTLGVDVAVKPEWEKWRLDCRGGARGSSNLISAS